MKDSVIKVSIDGKKYTDETKYLSLDSSMKTLKRNISSSITKTIPALNYTETIINYSLGYPAFYQVFTDIGNKGLYKVPMGSRTLFDSIGGSEAMMEQDKLHIWTTNISSSDTTVNIKYIIFYRNIV